MITSWRTQMKKNEVVIKSVVARKPVVETLIIRVLKTIDVEALLRETGNWTDIKILSEKTNGSFKFVTAEVTYGGIV